MSESNSEETKMALKKILMSMLSKDYPEILEIAITSYCYDDICNFDVYLVIKYEDLSKINGDELKTKVKKLGKYVLTGQDKINLVAFANYNR